MAIQEFSSPFSYRRGGISKALAAKRQAAHSVLVVGNAERPGLGLPHCPEDESGIAARAFDEMCAKRPLLPPGRR